MNEIVQKYISTLFYFNDEFSDYHNRNNTRQKIQKMGSTNIDVNGDKSVGINVEIHRGKDNE